MKVDGGRVTVIELDVDQPVAGVRITGQPDFGHASVNPDNTIALVLSGTNTTGKITLDYAVDYENGTTEAFQSDFRVGAPAHAAGWGQGAHYMLATDAKDDVVVETGDIHRKVYIGGDDDALSRADIARLEGISASKIDAKWLAAHPEYGGSESMALDADLGMKLWYEITENDEAGSSHWLMFERGHSYDDLGRLIPYGSNGESELHPLHITSWGEGDRPAIDSLIRLYQVDSANVVFTDVTISGGTDILAGSNLLFDDVRFEDEMAAFQYADGVTIRNSEFEEVVNDRPTGNTGNWQAHFDRIAGIYVAKSEGLLFENNFAHHSGWTDGYDEGGSGKKGQPPSQFSHNIYLQNTTTDVTFRDNIISQGASFGAQMRGGAFVEDNAFIDNNVGFSVSGGIYGNTGPIGNFSFVTDNLVTSAGYKEAPLIGAVSLGARNYAFQTTLLDNIVAHLSDPNDPADIAAKPFNNGSLKNDHDPFYDDTVIYNWTGNRFPVPLGTDDRGVDGLDRAALDQVTIQNYAAQLLGRADATVADLADYIGGLAGTDRDDGFTADRIIAWFQRGFGVDPAGADTTDSHRFVPSELADGIRWDNRINWTGDVLPGDGDDVDLGGNHVAFGSLTARVGTLDLGEDGALRVTGGLLRASEGIETGRAGGRITVDAAGQLWAEGHDNTGDAGELQLDLAGGRFANTGAFDGPTSVTVSGDAQALLGIDNDHFDLIEGSSLRIDGAEARVGFDGNRGGTAVFRMDDASDLTFHADATGIGRIGEFRSGAFGDAPKVDSGLNLGGGTLHLNLSAKTPGAGRHVLMEADELVGRFGEIDVTGLRGNRDLEVEIDYADDVVSILIGRPGQGDGSVSLVTVGAQDDARDDADLWAALTSDNAGWNAATETDIRQDGILIL